MQETLTFFVLVLTALLVLMQPIRLLIEQGRLAVSPKAKEAIDLVIEILEWVTYLFELISFFG